MLDTALQIRTRDRAEKRQRLRRFGARLSYWIVVTLAIVAAAPWTLVNTTERIAVQNLLFDEFQRWRPRVYADLPPIRVIEIDDDSLARLGRWPWPRARLGEIDREAHAPPARPQSRSTCCSTIPASPDDDARFAKADRRQAPSCSAQYFTNEGAAPRLARQGGVRLRRR